MSNRKDKTKTTKQDSTEPTHDNGVSSKNFEDKKSKGKMDFEREGEKVADAKYKSRQTQSAHHVASPTSDNQGLNFNHDDKANLKVAANVKTLDGRKGKMYTGAKT